MRIYIIVISLGQLITQSGQVTGKFMKHCLTAKYAVTCACTSLRHKIGF